MLEKEEVKKFLVDVIKDDDLEVSEINDQTTLIGDEGVFFDSVDVLELIVELENRYGIKVQDNDIVKEKFRTFETFFNFIKENL